MEHDDACRTLPKKNTLYAILLILWVGICAYFDVKLSAPFFSIPPVSLFAKFNIVLFLICVNLFWFYGLYNIIFVVFSYFLANKTKKLSLNLKTHSRVAILYATMNDFQENAVLSCIRQVYDNFDIYILDDSTDSVIKNRIDGFIAQNPEVRLIRRKNRAGFKAGNLNNALREINQLYEYFAVCDADTIIPEDFLIRLLPYFQLEENISFVQANQRANPIAKSTFASVFSLNTDLHWRHYAPIRERYGFLMFYGHGALIKTKCWLEVGGLPEVASEDLAFSSLLREKGYSGIFVQDVYCYEDFPLTYRSLRKRNKRWSNGTLEYLRKYFPAFLKDKKISWVEKIDVFFSALSLFQAFPFFIYVIVAAVMLPYSQRIFQLHIPVHLIYPDKASNFLDFAAHIKYYVNWNIDFFIMMLVASSGQLLPVAIDLVRKPVLMVRYISMFTFLCLATSVVSSLDVLEYLVTKKIHFFATGDSNQSEFAKEKFAISIELLFGVLFFYFAYKTANLWLLTVGGSLLLNIFVLRYNFENKILNAFFYVPFSMNVLTLILIGRSLA